jgi:hypothetical protein
MYTPSFGGRGLKLPSDFLQERIMELPIQEALTPFVAIADIKQRELLDAMWSGFRIGYARHFVFGASALFSLADQLEALVNPDYIY